MMTTEQRLVSLKEAQVILNLMKRRVYLSNQNLIGVDIGPTGSGKSYRALRRMELWYKMIKKPFNNKNLCFSTEEIMDRLNSGELTKGDMIIMEEGGVNMGNLDFQTSMAKIFNYVLQSFRNLNIILFINLPYFSMLNKNTRMLVHYMEESKGVNKKIKQSISKPFLLQTNQNTGKVYRHYPKIIANHRWEKVQSIGYKLPSKEIRQIYEQRKEQFVRGIISGGLESMRNKDKKRLTGVETQIWSLLEQGVTSQIEIASILQVTKQRINYKLEMMRKKGFDVDKFLEKPLIMAKSIGTPNNCPQNLISTG